MPELGSGRKTTPDRWVPDCGGATMCHMLLRSGIQPKMRQVGEPKNVASSAGVISNAALDPLPKLSKTPVQLSMGTSLRQPSPRQPGLRDRLEPSVAIGRGQAPSAKGARGSGRRPGDRPDDRAGRGRSPPNWVCPSPARYCYFNSMQQKGRRSGSQVRAFRPGRCRRLPRPRSMSASASFAARRFGLLSAPGVEIPIVEWALGRHGRRLRRLALSVDWRAFTVNTMRWPLSSRADACSTSTWDRLGRELKPPGAAASRARRWRRASGQSATSAETAAHERDRRRAQDGARQARSSRR